MSDKSARPETAASARSQPIHAFERLPVPPGAVGIHWFGQSSFALKDADGTILLIDPHFPRVRPPDEFIHAESPLDEATLKPDFVLLTHEHGDHTCVESLTRIRGAFPATRYYGPEESIDRLREEHFPEALLVTLTAGISVQLGELIVHAVWSKLPDGMIAGLPTPDVTHLGYVIEIGGVRVYVSGDLFNTCTQYAVFLEPIARLQPDIGLLTMHPTEGEFPFFAGAVELAVKLKLKAAVPAHYGCFTQRTYDPHIWAALFPAGEPRPIIIPYNDSIVFPV